MAYNSFLYLIYLAAKHTYHKIFSQELTEEQIFFEKISGKKYTKEKAQNLWTQIEDHKWIISEKLGRDVGFNVAAVDLLENFVAIETDFNSSDKRKSTRLNIREGISTFAC